MTSARGATLRITEIFFSLQGETSRMGLPTVFVRLTGCPLRCVWCDTEYAFAGGESMDLSDVLEHVARYRARYVCVTGGEPLAQRACVALLTGLCDAGYSVSLETSGALDVSAVDRRVAKILDVKAPGSGETTRNRWENLAHLTAQDEIKFVLADRRDYDWACSVLREKRLNELCPVLFSPAHGQLEPRELAEWILCDALPVRLQLQQHKIIWGDLPGH